MDRLERMKLEDLRRLSLEVRDGLIERQNNGKYPQEWNRDLDKVLDVLNGQIDDLSQALARGVTKA